MINEADEVEMFKSRLENIQLWKNEELTDSNIMQIVSFLQELKNIKLDYLGKKGKTSEKVICYRNDVVNIEALVDKLFWFIWQRKKEGVEK